MTAPNDGIDSILLPTDGSEDALAGAKRGIDVAVATGADVHVLSVVETSTFDGLTSTTDGDELRTAMEAEAETAVEAVASMARERDLEVTTATERGNPFRVIGDYADEAGVDAIAMGTKGRSGVGRVVLGSVTENVLRTASVPVLAVPPAASDHELTVEAVENVLLPTDGSEAATAAVDWGIAIADAFDAMVHALHSVDTGRVPTVVEPSEVLTDLERVGEDALETVRERAKAAGVSVTGTVANGPPARVIDDYVADGGADLVVIGTHGRSGLERQLLGSVTENVVRAVDVPVWCVPTGGE